MTGRVRVNLPARAERVERARRASRRGAGPGLGAPARRTSTAGPVRARLGAARGPGEGSPGRRPGRRGRVAYLIDAFNVMHRAPGLARRLRVEGPADAGDALVDALAAWLAAERAAAGAF